ncbi:MAG: hypothetical protein HYX76_06915 [Acidobacteria bacterium]|nr:hypothetical protein [Acidobacteriota bacterium]
MNVLGRFVGPMALAVLISGCAMALRSPRIADLKYNPGRYQDKTVSVEGVVTSSWGVPLVPFKVYKIDDGTGELTVISQNMRTPTRGARVRVKGKVNEFAVFGGQSYGLHLQEQSVHFKGGDRYRGY